MVSAVSRADKGQGIRRNLRCALRFCARRRYLIVVGDGRLSSILSSRGKVEIKLVYPGYERKRGEYIQLLHVEEYVSEQWFHLIAPYCQKDKWGKYYIPI